MTPAEMDAGELAEELLTSLAARQDTTRPRVERMAAARRYEAARLEAERRAEVEHERRRARLLRRCG